MKTSKLSQNQLSIYTSNYSIYTPKNQIILIIFSSSLRSPERLAYKKYCSHSIQQQKLKQTKSPK